MHVLFPNKQILDYFFLSLSLCVHLATDTSSTKFLHQQGKGCISFTTSLSLSENECVSVWGGLQYHPDLINMTEKCNSINDI